MYGMYVRPLYTYIAFNIQYVLKHDTSHEDPSSPLSYTRSKTVVYPMMKRQLAWMDGWITLQHSMLENGGRGEVRYLKGFVTMKDVLYNAQHGVGGIDDVSMTVHVLGVQ